MLVRNDPAQSGADLARFELEGHISGYDVYNSETLYRVALDQGLERADYVIKTERFRPDLIAKDFYGDPRYSSYIIFQAGGIRRLIPGTLLRLVTKEGLEGLWRS